MTQEKMTTDARRRLRRAVPLVPALGILFAIGLGQDASNRDTWLGLTPVASSATAATPTLPAPPANGELGFVITQFHVRTYIHDPKIDCPDGKLTVLKDDYLATLPAPEAARLREPGNEVELAKRWQAYGDGPNGTNICTNVREFMDRPPTPLLHGKVAWGFNLDDDDTGNGADNYTCKHENFAGPNGEKGIDNQFWRVRGCSVQYRGEDESGNGEHRTGFDDTQMTGEHSQVIRLRGVNSFVNDPDVEVLYANTADRPLVDTRRKPLSGGSYNVDYSGRKIEYRNVMHGKIVNGVLTTDRHDILLDGQGGQFDLQRGRMQLEFQPDGTIRGMVGGYTPLLQVMSNARGGGLGSIRTAGINCAGQYTAFRMMADGDKDPRTGKCSRISYAYELVAYPGFVNDVPAPVLAKLMAQKVAMK